MRKMSKELEKKVNTSNNQDKINWDEVRKTIKYIRRAGGEVINQHKRPRTFQLPSRPGLKLLGYGDFLLRAGFTRVYSEEEVRELLAIRRIGIRS